MNDNRCLAIRFNPPGPQTFKTVTLWPNMVDDSNVLTQAMLPDTDTKYIVKYDFTLSSTITIPDRCILEFDGGSISGGTINMNDALVVNIYNYSVFSNTTLSGDYESIEGLRLQSFTGGNI